MKYWKKNEFYYETDYHIEPIRNIWIKLRIEAGQKMKSDKPGIGVLPPPSGGDACPESVCEAVQQEATKRDNLRKLRNTNASERHLFVFIDGLQGPAYVSIRDNKLPQPIRKLQPAITHVWAAAEEGHLLYVWRGNASGWQDLTDIVNRNTPQ